MATTGGRSVLAPPAPGQEVPKEYVRQQLRRLGVGNVSEEELEYYASDLTQLIRSNLATDSADSAELRHDRSALFKTFPEDKENRGVHYLSSPSSTNSSSSTAPNIASRLRSGQKSPLTSERGHESPLTLRPGVDSLSPLTSGGGQRSPLTSNLANMSGRSKPVKMKRKVLRQGVGPSRIVEETESELESVSDRLAEDMSALSLTPLSSSTGTNGWDIELVPESGTETGSSITPMSGLKSFIRPSTARPHMRGVRRSDPVARYQEYRELWEHIKPPGERPRNALRWHIREQMMQQDVPYFEPGRRRVTRVNDYVVPTEKKRLALRWQVRHALALQ